MIRSLLVFSLNNVAVLSFTLQVVKNLADEEFYTLKKKDHKVSKLFDHERFKNFIRNILTGFKPLFN